MQKDAKIYIAGHSGLIGSVICRKLKEAGYKNILTKDHRQLDLVNQQEVEKFFKSVSPDYVILSAARVGGIQANTLYPAQFIFENLAIQNNVIHAAYLYGVKKLLFFSSACSYPRDSTQPIKEEYLLSGVLEPTNEAYAVAKIAGIKMCQAYNQQYGTNFICAMPANVYGPGDNFDFADSHVIPALIRRFHEAKMKEEPSVIVWGTGRPRRQFIYVDDIADAAIFLMYNYDSSEIINVGTEYDITIKELVNIIKEVVGYEGGVSFDTSKADGMPRKTLDVSRLTTLDWQAKVTLLEGIKKTYEWYRENEGKI